MNVKDIEQGRKILYMHPEPMLVEMIKQLIEADKRNVFFIPV